MTVLLLPGMSLNRTAYPDFGFATICPDFNTHPPGFVSSGEATMDNYVEALDSWLETKADWADGPRIVVGHSFGGMLAMTWLLTHRLNGPAAIDGLVLAATTAGPMFDVLRPMAVRIGGRNVRIAVGSFLGTWMRPSVMRTMKGILAQGVTEEVDFRRVRPVTDFRTGVAGWRNTDWRAMRCYRKAIDGFDVRGSLANITVPVEVLHGTRDTLFPSRLGRELADLIPDARFTLVPDGIHALGLSHPHYLKDAVTRLHALPCRRS